MTPTSVSPLGGGVTPSRRFRRGDRQEHHAACRCGDCEPERPIPFASFGRPVAARAAFALHVAAHEEMFWRSYGGTAGHHTLVRVTEAELRRYALHRSRGRRRG